MRSRRDPRVRSALLVASLAMGATALTSCVPSPGACDADAVRWVRSTNTVSVAGNASCTLGDLDRLTTAPVSRVAGLDATWLVGANIRLERGARLVLRGAVAGGDVDEVRLVSNNDGSLNATVSLRAEWGAIVIDHTRVTSWDVPADGPDTDPTNGRSFIHVRSFLDADGSTPRESRMDVAASDVGYLGHDASEAHGLVWNVAGSSPGLYDQVEVRGDVTGNRIHDNDVGISTHGAGGMVIVDNEVDHNTASGIDAHEGSDGLAIERNRAHDNGSHGIACSQRCTDIVIRGNTIEANAGNGVLLHRQVSDTLVEGNKAIANRDAGLAVDDCSRNTIRDNDVRENLQGIRLRSGADDNVVTGNLVTRNVTDGLVLDKGSEAPTAGNGHPKRNLFTSNTVTGNGGDAIDASDADDNLFASNVFALNAGSLSFVRSNDNLVRDSDLRGATLESLGGATSVSGFGTARFVVDSTGTTRLFDPAGTLFDPEEPLGTTVGPNGSELVLSAAQIGSDSVVVTRNLRVATSGTGVADPVLWEASGARRKEIGVRSTSGASTAFSFRVGDMAPDQTYRVLREGVEVGAATSDDVGMLAFTSDTASTAPVLFRIEP